MSESRQEHDLAALRHENRQLRAELKRLRESTAESLEIVRAVRGGEIDAFVVTDPHGARVYQLRSADVLYRSMVEQMSGGAAVFDDGGLLIYCNGHFASLIHATCRQLTGRSLLPFVAEESRSFFAELDAIGDTVRSAELLLRASDGASVPVEATLRRIAIDGGRVNCMIVTDLSERRRGEQLVEEARRKDEFLAMLGHELRTPLTALRAAWDLLARSQDRPGVAQRALEVMERQIAQLARLTEDLMDLARIRRGTLRLEVAPVDLRDVVRRAVEAVQPALDARHHELTVELPDRPLRARGDGARLVQVLANLLHNAAKFTPERGHVTVRLEGSGGEASVVVRDDGMGIAPALLPKVFDLFSQGGPAGSARSGLGLGLALVRSIVEMHGGRVAVHSAGPNQGSQVMVVLPLAPSVALEAPASP
jgi:PAS domain S-box-containing protein